MVGRKDFKTVGITSKESWISGTHVFKNIRMVGEFDFEPLDFGLNPLVSFRQFLLRPPLTMQIREVPILDEELFHFVVLARV